MKKVYQLISDYVRYELNVTYILCLLLFLIPAIALNYYFDFENSILTSFRKESWYFFLCFAYYATPLFYAAFTYVFLYKKIQLLRDRRFIFLLLFFPAVIAFDESFNVHKRWMIDTIENEILRYYIIKTLNHTVRFITYFLPILAYYIFLEKENKNFYGLISSKANLRPYLIMMFGIMLPLIILVSFSPDFQEAYPVYNMSQWKDRLPGAYWQQVVVFESMYLFDFVYIELLFRGIMIYTLYKYMGIECILAVAVLYCSYHFGKPMAETISSFAGGTILGLLSLRTRSLYGGIIIHAGIAFMMEAASFIQKLN